jgi:hypothetical protein
MSDQPEYGIGITASDQTAKGAKSAEKRLSQIPKRVGQVSKKSLADSEKAATSSGRGILRTFASVEKSAARVFGGKAISTGIVSSLGAIGETASAVGTGLGQAATAGSLLEGALTTVGVVASATVAILAAVGYAGYKLADSWAKGAASIGRTSDVIGVATKRLQEFQAAGERAGVDKGASTGAIAGIAQTMHDARFGRNQEALALMTRLGVKFKTGKDGQLDYSAMSLDLADAIARQKDAQTRRMIAGKFGISDAALPMFLGGSRQLKTDMSDADKNAAILSDADVAQGKRIVRKGAIVGQMKDRALMHAGTALGRGEETALDGIISGGRSIMDGGRAIISGGAAFTKSVHDGFAPAIDKFDRAVDRMVSSVASGVVRATNDIVSAARAAAQRYGIPASITLAQYALESGHGRSVPKGSNNPFGIKARHGEPYVWARTHEQDRSGRSYRTWAKFRVFSSLAEAFDEHARLLMRKPYARARRVLPDVDRFADALTGVYATDHDYGAKLRKIIHREGLQRFDQTADRDSNQTAVQRELADRHPEPIPVKVEIDMRGAPKGTKAKVTAGRSKQPAVSHAFAF